MIGKWFFAVGVAWGCTCSAPRPACELFDRARAVFSGIVLETNEDYSGGFSRQTLYLVRVEEGFRGLAPEQKEVFVDPGSFSSCYTFFEVGKKYLFYAGGAGGFGSISVVRRDGAAPRFPTHWQEKKDLKVYSVPMCSDSKEWGSAQEDVEWIRKRLRGETATRVYGQAVQGNGDYRGGDGTVPLAGANVILRSGDNVQTVVAGADGRFAFEGIAPARYGLHAEKAPWEGSYRADFTVAERGCAERTLALKSSGEVRGVVRNQEGRPLYGVKVELSRVLPGGGVAKHATLRGWTDQAGVFQLGEAPAGEFVVGVNVEEGPRPESAWPTTYFPGVAEARAARVLRLAPNGKAEGISFSLPNPMLTRRVIVRVLWADGSEVGDSAQAWAERIEAPEGSYQGARAASKSEVWLPVMQDYSYKIYAGAAVRGMRTIGSDTVILLPGSEPVRLEIRLREDRPR